MSQSASLHALAAAQMSQQTAESVGPSSAAAAATAASAAAAGAGGAMLFSPPPPRFTPSASSTSAAAAAAAAAPKRASVLLVHAGCYALDHSIVRITNDDSLLFRTPHRLLSLNGQLLKPFTAPYDQKHGQNTKAQTGASKEAAAVTACASSTASPCCFRAWLRACFHDC